MRESFAPCSVNAAEVFSNKKHLLIVTFCCLANCTETNVTSSIGAILVLCLIADKLSCW